MQDFDNDFRPYPLLPPIVAGVFGLGIGFFLYQIVGGILTFVIIGTDLENINVNAARLMTTAGQFLFMLLPALVMAKVVYGDVPQILRLKKPKILDFVIFGIGLVILISMFESYMYVQTYVLDTLAEKMFIFEKLKDLLTQFDEIVEGAYGRMLSTNNAFEVAMVIFVVSIVPAVAEEALFRGYIQKSFEFKLNGVAAAAITGFFFAAFHTNPTAIFPLFMLGFYFGLAAWRTGSIWVPVVLHFVNNFISLMAYFIGGPEELQNMAKAPEGEINTYILTFILLFIAFIVYNVITLKFYHKLTGGSDDMP